MDTLYPVCAGMDVHRDTVVVSIRKRDERGRERVETRTFETFNDTLVEMAQWLDENGVPIVGLESTGVYWKPVVRVLKLRTPLLVIWLVNPADVKKVPGRKTDVNDSQWLSKLVMHGLVSPSFLPSIEMEELRVLTRHRTKLIGEHTSCTNRIIKQLESAGIKLASVCSQVLGKSGRAMLDALLQGSEDPRVMAQLACGRLRTKMPLLQRALSGSFSDATKFILRQLLARFDQVERDIAALNAQVETLLQPYEDEVQLLMSLPGLDTVSIAAVLAEIGPDMSRFANADAISAWGGLCPGSNESAGKSKASPTRKGNKYLRTMLVQAAWAASKARGRFWQQKFRQTVGRLGARKAILAIARRMLVAIYYALRDVKPYHDPTPVTPPPDKLKRLLRRHTDALTALGFHVTLEPAPAPPTPS